MSTQADAVQSATPTTPAPALTPQQPHEILTVAEVASLLKCKESSIYNLTRRRGQVRYDNPIPVLRLPCSLRFKRSGVLAWLDSQEQGGVQ
jgi:predicted DNA-binding transcriptional regulator AlpA